MKIKFLNKEIFYDGSQLAAHWILKNTKIYGDAVVSFIGGCNVLPENIVDYEDKLNKQKIASSRMLHFIIEIFNESLLSAVLYQRLFASIVYEELNKQILNSKFQISNSKFQVPNLRRCGDDIYVGDYKLSISIATKSITSILIHFALNITKEGTPVKTKGLNDYKINPKNFAKKILKKFQKEYLEIKKALVKVKAV